VGVTATGVEPETNPEVERLLREQRGTRLEPMARRELQGELALALSFLVGCAGLLVVGGTEGFDVVAAVVLLVTYAAATRVRFEIGGGSTDPTLLVLIPALFIEPPAVVPLLIAGGFALGRSVDVVRSQLRADRLLAALGNSWHAIGPALVLILALDGEPPDLRHTPWYIVAFLAYVAFDTAAGLSREWATHGVRPRLQLQMLGRVYALDALLAPLGLMAALADSQEDYAFLLAVPLVAVLGILARERTRRLDHALALSESRTQLLEAELEATRARVEVLGAVSHGLQTPVAGIVAIAGVLRRRGPQMDPDTLVASVGHLEEDAVALRHLVRQGLDYVRLIEGAELPLRPQTFDVAATAATVASRTPGVVLEIRPPGGPVPVRGDAARVEQVLTALADRSMRASVTADAVRLTVEPHEDAVTIVVHDDGPPVDAERFAAITAPPQGALGTHEAEGTGVDLYVAAEIVRALGGTFGPAPSGGGLAVTLPTG
jgi:signal transduction histidine kinase